MAHFIDNNINYFFLKNDVALLFVYTKNNKPDDYRNIFKNTLQIYYECEEIISGIFNAIQNINKHDIKNVLVLTDNIKLNFEEDDINQFSKLAEIYDILVLNPDEKKDCLLLNKSAIKEITTAYDYDSYMSKLHSHFNNGKTKQNVVEHIIVEDKTVEMVIEEPTKLTVDDKQNKQDMKDFNITFVFVNRGGTVLDYVIKQYKKYYPYAEYIVVEQADDKLFARGQLFNIGYKHIKTDYMTMCDNDMFFTNYINLVDEYEKMNCCVLQPFQSVDQVKINPDDSYKMTSSKIMNYKEFGSSKNYDSGGGFACGGVTFISAEKFREINGYSNLYLGWGSEDNDFFLRTKKQYKYLEGVHINHITHPRRTVNTSAKIPNGTICSQFKLRNQQLDGVKQIIYELVSDTIVDDVRYIKVKNIYVPDDFAYKDIIDKNYKL